MTRTILQNFVSKNKLHKYVKNEKPSLKISEKKVYTNFTWKTVKLEFFNKSNT